MVAVLSAVSSELVQARENVTDWYIQDFRAEFDVQADSTMTVTEWITADCGQCVGKHGIFRTLPMVAKTPTGNIHTPVDLISITDFGQKTYQFTTSENKNDGTVTWKIGDPDNTVTGVNQYKIVYRVKNVIRDQGDFHEWYWNVVGNFWDLPIDSFSATVKLPDEATKDNTEVQLYSGSLGNKGNSVAEADWIGISSLGIKVNRGLIPGEGITVSLSFPTTIFTPYQFSWWELYGAYFWFLIPIIMFAYLYRMWRKHGDDPEWDKPTIPEYEVPAGLNALTMGSLLKNGRIVSEHVTAALIELAVKGVITIREQTDKILFFNKKEFFLERHMPTTFLPTSPQQLLLDTVFATGDVVKLSDLKHKFHPVLGEITKQSLAELIEGNLVERTGFTYRNIFVGIGMVGAFLIGFLEYFLGDLGWQAVVALVLSLVLFMSFGLMMPRRTPLGVETYAKLKGLKLYMETAEKYRQRFYEKEGIFETLLPVAILFGITKEWIKKMEAIYGPEYFASYHPAWLVGSLDGGFNTESFTSAMDSVSSSIAANMGTSSGAGGGGSSGGGGGGGGGGGW